jgi:hypothetical protein
MHLYKKKNSIAILFMNFFCQNAFGSLRPAFAFPQASMPFSPKVLQRSWHAGGAEYWNKIKSIVPKTYLVHRVNPQKPVEIEGSDVFAESWEHAPWTDTFVDIEDPEKHGSPP